MFNIFKDLWKPLLLMAVLLFLILASCQHTMNTVVKNGGLKAVVDEVWNGKETPEEQPNDQSNTGEQIDETKTVGKDRSKTS